MKKFCKISFVKFATSNLQQKHKLISMLKKRNQYEKNFFSSNYVLSNFFLFFTNNFRARNSKQGSSICF